MAWCSESVSCGNLECQHPLQHFRTADLCRTAPRLHGIHRNETGEKTAIGRPTIIRKVWCVETNRKRFISSNGYFLLGGDMRQSAGGVDLMEATV